MIATVAAIDYAALWAGIGAIIVSIAGGAIAMAWRLGGLESRVRDVQDDVHEVKGQVRDLDVAVDGLKSRIDRWPDRRIGAERRQGD